MPFRRRFALIAYANHHRFDHKLFDLAQWIQSLVPKNGLKGYCPAGGGGTYG